MKITTLEEEIITDVAAAENLSSYFETIAENLDLQNKADKLINDTLSDTIRTFENHPSIMKKKKA